MNLNLTFPMPTLNYIREHTQVSKEIAMDVHITTRHCQLTDNEHEAAVKAAQHLERYYGSIIRVDIIAAEDSGIKSVEFAVRVQGHTIVAKEQGHDHFKAIHTAREKLERQLKRLNDRLHNVRSTVAS
jgi:ribosomal subunit interface protein